MRESTQLSIALRRFFRKVLSCIPTTRSARRASDSSWASSFAKRRSSNSTTRCPTASRARSRSIRESQSPVYIRAVLHVERDSQKRILIGAGGQRIRDIGRAAREKIEAFVGTPMYLDLWVKVLPTGDARPTRFNASATRAGGPLVMKLSDSCSPSWSAPSARASSSIAKLNRRSSATPASCATRCATAFRSCSSTRRRPLACCGVSFYAVARLRAPFARCADRALPLRVRLDFLLPIGRARARHGPGRGRRRRRIRCDVVESGAHLARPARGRPQRHADVRDAGGGSDAGARSCTRRGGIGAIGLMFRYVNTGQQDAES